VIIDIIFLKLEQKHPSREVGNSGSFVANLLQYLHAKNYQTRIQFDKVIAKIRWYNFSPTVLNCQYVEFCTIYLVEFKGLDT